MPENRPQKSTTVRLLRSALRAGELVAPGLAARLVNRLWFSLPGRARPAQPPAGGVPFEVTSQGTTIRGRVWGEGPLVYLVHGWAGRGADLSAFVAPLVAKGRQVVMFDGPSHGASDPGVLGPGRAHGVELGRALDAVFMRFGPAEAVLAHSMGSVATVLTLKYGWLSTERLVLLAPMDRLSAQLSAFGRALRVGARTRHRMEQQIEELVGLPVPEFDTRRLLGDIDALPLLVVHDRGDRVTPHTEAEKIAGSAHGTLITTAGLGHHRILRDETTVQEVVSFVTGERGEAAAA
jgi:pimeloyl-ACP methyl ester carboxylesterase